MPNPPLLPWRGIAIRLLDVQLLLESPVQVCQCNVKLNDVQILRCHQGEKCMQRLKVNNGGKQLTIVDPRALTISVHDKPSLVLVKHQQKIIKLWELQSTPEYSRALQ